MIVPFIRQFVNKKELEDTQQCYGSKKEKMLHKNIQEQDPHKHLLIGSKKRLLQLKKMLETFDLNILDHFLKNLYDFVT